MQLPGGSKPLPSGKSKVPITLPCKRKAKVGKCEERAIVLSDEESGPNKQQTVTSAMKATKKTEFMSQFMSKAVSTNINTTATPQIISTKEIPNNSTSNNTENSLTSAEQELKIILEKIEEESNFNLDILGAFSQKGQYLEDKMKKIQDMFQERVRGMMEHISGSLRAFEDMYTTQFKALKEEIKEYYTNIIPKGGQVGDLKGMVFDLINDLHLRKIQNQDLQQLKTFFRQLQMDTFENEICGKIMTEGEMTSIFSYLEGQLSKLESKMEESEGVLLFPVKRIRSRIEEMGEERGQEQKMFAPIISKLKFNRISSKVLNVLCNCKREFVSVPKKRKKERINWFLTNLGEKQLMYIDYFDSNRSLIQICLQTMRTQRRNLTRDIPLRYASALYKNSLYASGGTYDLTNFERGLFELRSKGGEVNEKGELCPREVGQLLCGRAFHSMVAITPVKYIDSNLQKRPTVLAGSVWLYVVGGKYDKGLIKSCEKILINSNRGTESFQRAPPLNEPKREVGLCPFENRYIYSFTGLHWKRGAVVQNIVERLDVMSEHLGWKAMVERSTAKDILPTLGNPGVIQINSDQFLIFGGWYYYNASFKECFLYNIKDRKIQRSFPTGKEETTVNFGKMVRGDNMFTLHQPILYMNAVYALGREEYPLHILDLKSKTWSFIPRKDYDPHTK